LRFKYSDLKKIKNHMYNKLGIKTKYKFILKKRHDIVVVNHNGVATAAFAAMNPDLKQVILPILDRTKPSSVPHIYFCLAHEIGHIWQHEIDVDTPFNEAEADDIAFECLKELFGCEYERCADEQI